MEVISAVKLIAAVTVAILSFLGIAFGGFFSYLAAKHSRQANDAVNHTGEDSHRIYDLAQQNHKAILDTQSALVEFMLSQTAAVDRIEKEVQDHVEWEMRQTYPDPQPGGEPEPGA
jgi:hypothetical protein